MTTATISELKEEFGRIFETWEHAGAIARRAQLDELKYMLDQLWQMPTGDALDLRRRVRSLIDEAEHARKPLEYKHTEEPGRQRRGEG